MKRVRLIDKSVRPTMSILDAIADHALFARWFNRSDSWDAWLAFLAALFALPMTPQQLKLYRQCTGREAPPQSVAAEVWLVIGRRGGKSFILALIAIYLAAFFDYRKYLAADSGASRPPFRNDVAHPFRDYSARRSEMMSPTIPG